MLPPLSAPTSSDKNVVYHVYQHGQVEGVGHSFTVNNFPVAYYLRPVLLFLQWGFWVIYLAGAAQVRWWAGSLGGCWLDLL